MIYTKIFVCILDIRLHTYTSSVKLMSVCVCASSCSTDDSGWSNLNSSSPPPPKHPKRLSRAVCGLNFLYRLRDLVYQALNLMKPAHHTCQRFGKKHISKKNNYTSIDPR